MMMDIIKTRVGRHAELSPITYSLPDVSLEHSIPILMIRMATRIA